MLSRWKVATGGSDNLVPSNIVRRRSAASEVKRAGLAAAEDLAVPSVARVVPAPYAVVGSAMPRRHNTGYNNEVSIAANGSRKSVGACSLPARSAVMVMDSCDESVSGFVSSVTQLDNGSAGSVVVVLV